MSKNVLIGSVKIDNGETLGYRECGEGDKILLLVHGNMTSSKHWDVLIDKLPDNIKVYAVDMRGFGMSTYNKPVNSLRDFSEDIKNFVDKLGLKKFAMAGWSTGGGVAMQFAADHPEYVTHLITVESVGIKGYPMFRKDEKGQPVLTELLRTKDDIVKDQVQVVPVLKAYASKDKEYMRSLWNMVIYTQNQPSPGKYDEYLDDMMTQRNLVDVDYALVNFNMSHDHNGVVPGTGEVDKITAPTLVIEGDKDLVVPMYMAEDIKNGIGDNAELVIFENSGHSPLIDSIDKLTDSIVDFIS